MSGKNIKRILLAAAAASVATVLVTGWAASSPRVTGREQGERLASVGSRSHPGGNAAPACSRTGAETVATDKPSYPHYATVEIKGNGYAPGCQLGIRVTRPNGTIVAANGIDRRGRLGAARVDGAGAFAYTYHLSKMDGRYQVAVLGSGGAVLARSAFMDAFGINKLFLNSTTGSEDYQFTAGNTVYAQGTVDAANGSAPNRSYEFIFSDPSGAVRATTPCTSNGPSSATVWATYQIQASDPVSTAAEWHAVLKQFLNKSCTTVEKTSSSLAFDVAKTTAYSNAALTTQQSFFPAGAAAFLTATGLKASQTGWSTTWKLPGGATACSNTSGTDRPGSDANALLPTGTASYLQYAPGTTGSAWNLQKNYDTGSTCPAFSSANQGPWSLTLSLNSTHFVSVSPFTVDTTAPAASAGSSQYTSSPSITISYTAADNTGGSGLAAVALYAKGPTDSGYSKVATSASAAGSGSFSYTAAEGDGSYSFYTIATDKAGNVQATPSANTTTVLDTKPPSSTASSPQYATSSNFTVPYTASDSGSGLAKVDLYVKGPTDSGYSNVGTITSSAGAGSFSYNAGEGDGNYSFYTVATDNAGNVQASPGGPNSTTRLDTTAPTSSASSSQYATSPSIGVSYTAADSGTGLAKVDLYVKGPSDSGYSKVATNAGSAGSGSFTYNATKGDGGYSFYTIATSVAGNVQATPTSPNTSTVLDTAPPASTVASPQYSSSSALTVTYTASDAGSGVAEVDLYAKGPTDSAYSKVGTDKSGSGSGSFSYSASEGDGTYSFYTIAIDKVGNVQATPSSPQATMVLDTTPPSSTASSPQYSTSSGIVVSYSASAGSAGLAGVALYAKGPTDSGYAKVATTSSSAGSGSFTYSANEGDGTYSFYTIATDNAANTQATATSPNTTTQVDTTAPTSSASSSQFATSPSLSVSYSAAAGVSGLAKVDLYAKGPNDGGYTKVASDTSGATSGSFSYAAGQGDGSYSFYTVATGVAGGVQAAPASANTTTVLDTTAPSSHAGSPSASGSVKFAVSYNASDGTGSGVREVDLYAMGPTDSGYAKVAGNTSPGGSGSFSYTATEGNGSYSFYTIATDNAGNAQATPSGPDTTTAVNVVADNTPPSSSASSAQYTSSSALTVSYTASDNTGGSGVAEVDLYAKGPTDSAYTKVFSDASGSASGSYTYTAAEGDGNYSFYTVATDNAGNTQATPASPNTTTVVDTAAPSSSASVPQYSTSRNLTVSYAASDSTGGSGVGEVDLYAKGPTDSAYTEVAVNTAPSSAGSFSYPAAEGDGSYSFYTIATDKAGNTQATPAGPNATTLLDTTAPSSIASTPQYADSTALTVSYTASDGGGSGLGEVDLYAKGPTDSGYTKVASDTSGSSSGSFTYNAGEGDGSYSFYTVATDKAGNAQATPSSASATTQLDTSAPSSQASSAQYSTTASFTVSYTAADDPAGSGLARVDLYAEGPTDNAYSLVTSNISAAGSGSFSYTATEGQGPYHFYTVATDNAGNVEPRPDATDPTTPGDTTVRYDSTPPVSQANSPTYANTASFNVTYTASDANSGLTEVDLYAKGPTDSGYSLAATDPNPATSGDTFAYNGTEGNGTYSFFTIATDNAGNVQAVPTTPDSTTTVNPNAGKTDAVDEIHYTFTGGASVSFDWRGSATDLRYGTSTSYGNVVTAHTPSPLPFSSAGPFQQADISNLLPGTTYHYSIGGGVDHTFTTAPTGTFRFDVQADIGSSLDYANVPAVQNQIAGDTPAFVIEAGDLTYAEPFGQARVDQHFNDIMAWSTTAADMPAWGNHEWDAPQNDDLRNYKGRYELPNAQTSPSAPAAGCCGEDWSWFDAGGVRFISYPEPYTGSTWTDWQAAADPIFAAAQADPSIHFIVTFGHRPAYSTGYHPGDPTLQSILNGFGDKYSKYVLNINGHSHDYERFHPIHGVTNITTGGASSLEEPWTSTDPNSAFRAFHLEHLRIDVDSTGMRIDAICGPPVSTEDTTCVQGSVLDEDIIGTNPPPLPTPPNTIYVDQSNPSCSDSGSGTVSQPYCSITPAASRVQAGQTVLVGNGTYQGQTLTPGNTGTATNPIVFAAMPNTTPTIKGATHGILVSGLHYITVEGFTITGTSSDGIVVKNSSNVTIRGNEVSFAGQPVQGLTAHGIQIDGVTDSIIQGNNVHNNTDYGIYLLNGSTGNEVIGNRSDSNARVYTRAASGIRIYASTNNIISGNYTYNNEDSGIEFFNLAGSNVVIDNISYGNGDHGIDDNNAPCQTIVSNSVYNNFTAGINLEGNSPGGIVENNISVNNGMVSTRTRSNIRVDAASNIAGTCVDGTPVSGPTVDYNEVYLSSPGDMYEWGTTLYTSLSAFQAATGQESHGIQADPQWVDPANGDFHLQGTSPAIDSANSAAPDETLLDAAGQPRIDDPYVKDTGAGPRTYDDRGALELQPEPPPNQPPTVSFTVTPNAGTAPYTVTADASASTDTDSSGIATYTFDFGDGTVVGPQSSPTATHTYTTVGIQTVKVTVTDTAGMASTSTQKVLVRDAPPTAALSVTPTSGSAPLQVTADGSASADNDSTPIASYTFNFGDGTAAAGPQAGAAASHTYSSPGTYTVSMTVTDTAGNTSTSSTQVAVSSSPLGDAPPTPVLSVTPSAGTAPLQVMADASASTDTDATPIATYTFNFGDGSSVVGPQTSPTVHHTYASAGTYTVTMTVTDTGGNSSSATQQVTVSAPDLPPAAALTVTPSSAFVPMAVTADASGSTDNDVTPIASYTFNFGDGSAAVGPQASSIATHTYSTAGTYTVTVTVADSLGQTSTATRQVNAYVNLVGNPGFEAGTSGWNTSGGGSGVTLTQVAGGHSGSYAAKLANTGGSNSTCLLNDSPNWVAKSTGTAYTGTLWVRADSAGATLNLRFREYNSSQVLVGTKITSVGLTTSWQLVTVTLPVSSPGSAFDFNAYVTNAPPGTCFYADDAVIYNGSPLEYAPNAALAVTPSSGIAPLQVTANAAASSDTDSTPVATYTFDFGDGSPVVGPQASATANHSYTTPGTHTVKVTVTDTAGNSSTTTTQVYIGDAPPTPVLSVSPTSGAAALQVTADASGSSDPDSTGVASYTFDFGDGTVVGPQSSPTASHLYTSLGPHTVTLTVTDSAGNASSTSKQVLVTDGPPTASLNVTPTSGTAPLQVTADASASTAGSSPIASYTFSFGDGSAAVGPQSGAMASHTYTIPGTYTVTTTVTDTSGSTSTATTQVTVSKPADLPPNPSLTVSPSSGVAPLQVTADGSGSTPNSSPIASYTFDFGDGTVVGPQASPTAPHTYTATGTYTVTMTVTDTAGNSSVATTQVAVNAAQPPNAVLNLSPSSGTAPLQVTADGSGSNAGSAPIASYTFDFGDGSGAVGPQSGPTATHSYTTPGTYTVTMSVTDSAGNTSIATTQVTVKAPPDAPPAAALNVTPSTGTTPLQITADASASTDTDVTPIGTYKFNFGDGSAVVGPQAGATATHTYSAPGTYTVTVTVTDTAGNASTASQQVTATAPDLPPAAALTMTPSSGLVPLAVTADASASTDTDATPIGTYKFNFGDGSAVVGPQAGATATHTYSAPGTYTVTATVADTVGNASTVTKQVTAYANLVGNPGFESGTSGWNTSGGGTGVTLTQVSGGHSGSFAARLTNTNTTASTILLNDSPNWVAKTNAGQYTGSLWVRADTAGATLNLRFREYNTSNTLVGTKTTSITLSTNWQQVSVTLPVSSPGSTFDYNAYVTSAPAGSSFYADDAVIYNG